MKYIYFDALSGLSGDMILGALLDLGVSSTLFKEKMAEMNLPVKIQIKVVRRAALRGLKVNVLVQNGKIKPRKWPAIEKIIEQSPFSSSVKKNSLVIFKKLFEAEARAHGQKLEETHLHEAGANDSIIDIVGCCFLAETLNVGRFYSSPLNLGQGWVKGSHGLLPVPAPAVTELLKGIPVYSAWAKEELVTPTGAAIVSTLVKKFIPFPEICYEKIGCGAGHRDFPEFPNILRVFYGDMKEFKAGNRIFIIETNVDDSSPQIMGSILDKAFELGALDAFLTPVFMKKNRLATKLTVLAEADKIDTLIDAIFRETSSIGVRYFPVERRVLERKAVKVNVRGEDIAVKVAYLEGKEVNIQPEFSDCLKLAKKSQKPVKSIIELARAEFAKKSTEGSQEKDLTAQDSQIRNARQWPQKARRKKWIARELKKA